MNIFTHFETQIVGAVGRLKDAGVLPQDVSLSKGLSVEPPRDASHGDIATNVAMVLAKHAKMKPRDLAEKIAEELRDIQDIENIEIAGPGFINLTLSSSFWIDIPAAILEQGADYGRSDIGQGEAVNVEYVSANPTGPLHVGHCRGAVFGDALANLLQFAGFDVTREYYINDAGAQVDVLAQSVYLRYAQALGKDIGEIPQGLYPGGYLIPVGEALAEKYGEKLLDKDEDEWLPILRDAAVAANMEMIKDDLAVLDIKHDVFFSERSLIEGETNEVAETLKWLEEKGLIYKGKLPPPKGRVPDDWDDREQTLFRATEFGDDIDRALLKADGDYTYFASDMAYHKSKYDRGFKTMIDVLGADHGGYVKRMEAAVKALTDSEGALDVKICQLVKLFRAGEPVKMSKRAGEFITVRDLVDEVGSGPVRFMMLYRKNEAPLDFDFTKVVEQSRDNPIFYVQYAHARICSVFREAQKIIADLDPESPKIESPDLNLLKDGSEIALMRRLAHFPRIIESAATAHEPHRISFYLYDLAGDFHALWNRGKESPQLRFIRDDDLGLTQARLTLILAASQVLASGLGILGVKAIREMR